MPLHGEAPSLKSLCLGGIGKLVVALAPLILADIKKYKDPQQGLASLHANLRWLQILIFSNVPCHLYDTMATHVLTSIKGLIEKTKKTYDPLAPMSNFITEMNVFVSLTEVVLSSHLRRVDFSSWPKIMRYVLYKNLGKLTGLRVLNLGSCTGGWRTSETDRGILEGIAQMKNLTTLCLCFDCTDCIIQVIGENCAYLQSLDVTSSRSVTDRSIPSLLNCKRLRELQLHRTSVSVVGIAQLVYGLKRLEDIGRCDEFGNVIKYLERNYPNCGPFGLNKLQIRDLNTDSLRLLVKMCPKIENVSLFHDDNISNLTVLATLNFLSDLKLLSCKFYTHALNKLLDIRGTNLKSLHLEHVEEIDLNAIIHISQCCPKLENLVLYNCDFNDQTPAFVGGFRVKPFQNLQKVFWVVDCAIMHLEFLLLHSVNIRFIHLGSSTGITHDSVVKILAVNPMRNLEELRILYSSDMNIETVQRLVTSCPKLKVLSELESWQGITTDDLKTFKEFLRKHNFDLDVRPILSY